VLTGRRLASQASHLGTADEAFECDFVVVLQDVFQAATDLFVIAISDVFPQRLHSTSPGTYMIELTVKDKARPFAGGSTTRTISFLPEIR